MLRAIVGLTLALFLAPAVAPAAEPGCTEFVGTTRDLRDRAANAGDGAVVCVRSGGYGEFAVSGRHLERGLTLQAAPDERPVVDGFSITDSSRITVRGLHVTGDWGVRGAEDLTIAGNDFDGSHGNLRALKRSTIDGNRIHDLQTSADEYVDAGLWINSFDGSGRMGTSNAANGLDGLLIRNNRFVHICSDAIQIGGGEYNGTTHVTIERNEFERIAGECDPAAHSDSIQLLGGSNITVVSNVFRRVQNACVFKDARLDDLLVQNNLMIMSDDTPGGTGIMCQIWDSHDTRIINNTVVAPKHCCLTGFMLRSSGSAVVANNFFSSYSVEPGVRVTEHSNVVGRPSALNLETFDPAPGGPLVDAAGDDSPPLDRLGRRRNGASDIGAQELQSGAVRGRDRTTARPVLKRISAKPKIVRARGSFRVRVSVNVRARCIVSLHRIGKGARPRLVTSFTRSMSAGEHTVRISGAALRPGRYRVSMVVRDGAGNRSPLLQSRFKKR